MGHLRDAGDVGGKLHDQRTAGGALRRGHHLVERSRVAAELQSALGCVGAGDIQFVGGDAFAVVENLDRSFVVLAGVAEDVGQHNDVFQLPELRQLLCQERGRADVLEADGVEHAGSGLPQTRRRIANHRFAGETFDHESAQLVEVNDILKLDAVAEGAAGGDDGVLELDASKAHAKIQRRLAVLGGRGHWSGLSLADPAAFSR